jgi:hypothetical protein
MILKNITLTRKRTGNQATYGHLIVETLNHGVFKFTTIENTKEKIQKGKYLLDYTFSPRFKCKTLQLMDVKGRTGIRIHPANRYNDLSGCIGLGLYNTLEEIPNQIFYSRAAVETIESLVNEKNNYINIINNEEQDTIKISRNITT